MTSMRDGRNLRQAQLTTRTILHDNGQLLNLYRSLPGEGAATARGDFKDPVAYMPGMLTIRNSVYICSFKGRIIRAKRSRKPTEQVSSSDESAWAEVEMALKYPKNVKLIHQDKVVDIYGQTWEVIADTVGDTYRHVSQVVIREVQ